MPPHNLFDSDCQNIGVGQFFDSLLSTSLNTLSPMCNDSAVSPMCNDSSANSTCDDSGPRAHSPMYPMNQAAIPGKPNATRTSKARSSRPNPVSVATAPDPRRPPLNPIKPKPSYRNRKKLGLSINVPRPPADPHKLPPSPPIYCAKNVELRRKSLSEQHFFRPVSEDEESVVEKRQM